jgi:hypothetical protein
MRRKIPARFSTFLYTFAIESFRRKYGPGVDPTSNRNECQGYMLGLRRTGGRADNLAIFMCLHVLEIVWASTSCSPRGLSRAAGIASFSIYFCVFGSSFGSMNRTICTIL